MKRVLVLLFLISGFTYSLGFAAGKGFITNGTFKVKGSDSIKTTDNNGVYAEVYINQDQIPGAIVGFGIRLNDITDDATGNQVAFLATYYGAIRYELDLASVKPYAEAKIGYPGAADGKYLTDLSATNDLKGLNYLSLGLGVKVLFIDASVSYELNTFKLTNTVFADKDAYTGNVAINVGVKF